MQHSQSTYQIQRQQTYQIGHNLSFSPSNSPKKHQQDTLALPSIVSNAKNSRQKQNYKLSTQRLSYTIKKIFKTEELTHKSSYSQVASQISHINDSILKRIEEKIYPLNKEISKKIKLRKDLSQIRQNKHNLTSPTQKPNLTEDINLNIPSKHRKSPKPTVILNKSIQKQYRNSLIKHKRTQSQEQIINLQAKVQTYLKQKRKQLKQIYDHEIQQCSIKKKQSTHKQLKKQKSTKTTIKTIKSIVQQKQKKGRENNCFINKCLLTTGNDSELKKVLRLFQERKNNFTTIEPGYEERMEKERNKLNTNLGGDKENVNKAQKLDTSIKKICEGKESTKKIQKQTIKEFPLKSSKHLIKRIGQQQKQISQTLNYLPTQTTKNIAKNKSSAKLTTKNQLSSFHPAKQKVVQIPSNFNILPSHQNHTLNKELLELVREQLLDEKNNLMRKKINHGKLIKNRKNSELIGMPIH